MWGHGTSLGVSRISMQNMALKTALREAVEFERFELQIRALTDLTDAEARKLAKIVPASFRPDALNELARGASAKSIEDLLADTLYSQAWQLGFAGRELVRACLGIPLVGGPLRGDELRRRLVEAQGMPVRLKPKNAESN